jgi:fucose permease
MFRLLQHSSHDGSRRLIAARDGRAHFVARFPLPAMGQATRRASGEARKGLPLWIHRNLVFGVPTIVIYLIAEIGVSNPFINFISMEIAGGALVVVPGRLADRHGQQLSFLLTTVCEVYVLFYALRGAKPTGEQRQVPTAD